MARQARLIKADEIAVCRQRLATSATGHIHRAAEKAVEYHGRHMPPEDFKMFFGRLRSAAGQQETDEVLAKTEKRYRKASRIEVKPRTPYADWGSPHSCFADRFQVESQQRGIANPFGDRATPGAEERLADHARFVAYHVDKGSRYGKQVERMFADQLRGQSPVAVRQAVAQYRSALTTGGGASLDASGAGVAAFVLPPIILDHFTTYRPPSSVIAGQVATDKLSPYGLTAYVPSLTAGTSVTTTTEGSATADGQPTMGFITADIVEKSGQVQLSQAVVDRVGPGMTADRFLVEQLRTDLDAQIDAIVIAAMLASPNTITNSGSFSLGTASSSGGFLANIKSAKQQTIDTAGTRIRSTHIFCQSDLADYLESLMDAQGRPIFTPKLDDGKECDEGWSGFNVSGLQMYCDENIPTVGTSELLQIIVTRPSHTVLMEGTPSFRLFPQYAADNLSPIIAVNTYAAALCRYAKAVSVVTGAAYALSNFNA